MAVDLAIHSIGELIFIVFFHLSVMIGLYAFFSFLSQRGPLRLQLTQIEAELDLLCPKLPKKRLKVRLIRRTIQPLHQNRQQYSYYFRILQDVIRDFDLQDGAGETAEGREEEEIRNRNWAGQGRLVRRCRGLTTSNCGYIDVDQRGTQTEGLRTD